MSEYRILVTDPIAEEGIRLLEEQPEFIVHQRFDLRREELRTVIPEYHGVILRSGTNLDEETLSQAKRLRLVGRAGTGVDNVNLQVATRLGIAVMNTPGENAISAAEHTIALVLSLARNIPAAHRSLQEGRWDRKRLTGSELRGKRLGLIGLGRVGREVAKRASGFEMKCFAYDPYVTRESAAGDEVELVDLSELLSTADFVSLHVPLTDQTKHLIGPNELAKMKPTAFLINCARGGILDEIALADAIRNGQIRGAALDVYNNEPPDDSPLLSLDSVVLTPHLGASTEEAVTHVGLTICRQVAAFFLEGRYENVLNVPLADPAELRRASPYLDLAEKIGKLLIQIVPWRIQEIEIESCGDATSFSRPITLAVLKGLLDPISGEEVNYVNAPVVAQERGIHYKESIVPESRDYGNLITVQACNRERSRIISGSLFSKHHPRIVRINDYHMDVKPQGVLLMIVNRDVPGVIGKVGTFLGTNSINIAEYRLGRHPDGEKAMALVNLDEQVGQDLLSVLQSFEEILDVKQAIL